MRVQVGSALGRTVRAFGFAAVLALFPAAAAAAKLVSLTVTPTSIVSGSPLTVTVAFDAAAPPAAFVTLTSTDPAIVDVQGTGVSAGAVAQGVLVAKTGAVTISTQVTIQASYGGVNKTAVVTVTPRVPVRGTAGDLWADIILGKPEFGEIVPNEVTGRTLFIPAGAIVDRSATPNRVYVFDGGNSRILGLSHLGSCAGGTKIGQPCTSNSDCPASACAVQEGRNADLVLGQPSFGRSACNGEGAFQRFPLRAPASAATLCTLPESSISVKEAIPIGNMFVDGSGNLYVPDSENNRVLRYNSPFTTDTIADDIWGQADFTGNLCRRGQTAPDAQSFCSPAGVALDSANNLWVADSFDHRVLRFPYDPGTGSAHHQSDLVLGQPDFSSFSEGAGLNQMQYPAAVRVDNTGSVYVADEINARILIFDPPLSSGMNATRQLNYAFSDPTGLEMDPAGGIWVNDSGHQEPDKNQLLLFVGGVVQKVLYKDVAGSNGAGVVGDRPDFVDPGGAVNSSWNLLWSRASIGIDNDGNVLASGAYDDLWRFPAPIPTPTLGAAHSTDARLFKPRQFWSPNEVGLSGAYAPSGVAVAGNQLIVADGGRLLFWDNPPNLANGQTASGFVGATDPLLQQQPYFGRIREDQASHLWATRAGSIVAYELPLVKGATPSVTINPPLPVLGGGNLTWTDLTIGGVAPVGAGNRLWVADPVGNRVFRVRNPLTSPVVDIVLGQTSASEIACNQGRGELQDAPSRDSLCNPGAVALDRQGNLYVADDAAEVSGNFRLLEYDASLFPDAPVTALFAIPASRVFGTGGSFTASAIELAGAPRRPFRAGIQLQRPDGGRRKQLRESALPLRLHESPRQPASRHPVERPLLVAAGRHVRFERQPLRRGRESEPRAHLPQSVAESSPVGVYVDVDEGRERNGHCHGQSVRDRLRRDLLDGLYQRNRREPGHPARRERLLHRLERGCGLRRWHRHDECQQDLHGDLPVTRRSDRLRSRGPGDRRGRPGVHRDRYDDEPDGHERRSPLHDQVLPVDRHDVG